MKKPILTLAAFMALNAATVFAAPLNDLSQGQTAIGLGTDTFYLEHKLSNNFTLGYQNVDYDHVGDMDDIYGQFNLTDNLRGIIGSRSFHSDSKAYIGMGVNSALSPDADGYASFIAGDHFKEFQVGTNIKLSYKTDLNLNYYSFKPDGSSSKTGVGVGATIKL